MGRIVKKCDRCGKYCAVCNEDDLIDNRNNCGGSMIDTGISFDEFNIIRKLSSEDGLLDAMVELKKKDIIEYNLKISQFKTQLQQQKSSVSQSTNTVLCPRCGSTNITAGQRGYSLLTGFVGSGSTVNRCANCGHKWKP